jgi:general secretion pathway protein G
LDNVACLYYAIGAIVLPVSFSLMMLSCSADMIGDSRRSREVRAKADVDACARALENYREDMGAYPLDSDGLQALRANPGTAGWNGPYLIKEIAPDPWGHPYQYPRDSAGIEVMSYGRDAERGREQAGFKISNLQPLPSSPDRSYFDARTAIFLASATVFFAYPFLPTLANRLRRRVQPAAASSSSETIC